MSNEAKSRWVLGFTINATMNADASKAMMAYLAKHPRPWRSSFGNITDARGASVAVIDGDDYEGRYTLAQALVVVVNAMDGREVDAATP